MGLNCITLTPLFCVCDNRRVTQRRAIPIWAYEDEQLLHEQSHRYSSNIIILALLQICQIAKWFFTNTIMDGDHYHYQNKV